MEGTVNLGGDWPQGQVRSYAIVLANNRTWEEKQIFTSKPLAYYWPTRPDGPWFSYRDISQEAYAESRLPEWPANIEMPLEYFKYLKN